MNYSVQEVADLLNMNVHTIRYYTDQGLIPHLKRDVHGYRQFNEEAINWLIIIYYLRQCEMTIRQIRTYINLCVQGNQTIDERYQIIVNLREKTEQQLRDTKTRLEFLNEKLTQFDLIFQGEVTDELNPINWTNKKDQFISEQHDRK
ncbi:MerR family transcriptional regulator [Tetragenococcus koreensis]|uniref:MerR family transcriptional regulator n=1 Tax=Tetragenococcus koreensis TaxID=290335 RepID=UPI000F50352E|nr:MerR family transcriptional regulator [Tetragenococcus koreensis]AYW45275.1 MerR family transcriptional regulator [Tetragenococcus koreensis]MCF1619483.1 MerR family transcriptional regulator [Tetragenococcus koreensis]MCF1656965.1 MerR family transcriptional regulator [Tetragenococcus koreensis]GEN90297.1 MerR family transcriptional regulator [Tetragenococcus koreensis]